MGLYAQPGRLVSDVLSHGDTDEFVLAVRGGGVRWVSLALPMTIPRFNRLDPRKPLYRILDLHGKVPRHPLTSAANNKLLDSRTSQHHSGTIADHLATPYDSWAHPFIVMIPHPRSAIQSDGCSVGQVVGAWRPGKLRYLGILVFRRHLYKISASELGISAKAVEAGLGSALRLCSEWKAVCLIDEADVFRAARNVNNLERNEFVFESGIDITLSYKPPTEADGKQIWTNFLRKFDSEAVAIGDAALDRLACWGLNGR
ncbi:AAA family ATPase [Paraphaeosphaeria sporulosa]